MFGAFVVGAVLLTIAVAVGLVILFFFQRGKQEFGFHTLFATYFYLVAVISLMAAFFGTSLITKAVASDIFGRDFSYYNYTKEFPAQPVPAVQDDSVDVKKQQAESVNYEKERIEAQYQEDLFNGISLLVVGLLFLGVHIFGWRKLESAQVRPTSILYRAYIIIQLVIFSIIALITLPLALGNVLRYWLQTTNNGTTFTPGEPVSLAIWATPIWLFFVWWTIKTLQQQKAT